MGNFVTFHILRTVAPSNMNRDDMGRPKTCRFGGYERLRISSQSQKRAWRTSEIFEKDFGPGLLGHLSRELGARAYEKYEQEVDTDLLLQAIEVANELLDKNPRSLWKNKSNKLNVTDAKELRAALEKEGLRALFTKQAIRLHDYEVRGYEQALQWMFSHGLPETWEEVQHVADLVRTANNPAHSVDIAMFGRMMASLPEENMDGSVMVSHALSVDPVEVETDYFSSVEDFPGVGGTGSAHIGEKDFASATMYQVAVVDVGLLTRNLGETGPSAKEAVCTFLKAMTLVNPSGSQNTFTSLTPAEYVRVEVSEGHPLTLHQAFERPIKASKDQSVMEQAVKVLEEKAAQYEEIYAGVVDTVSESFSVPEGRGSLQELISFLENNL